MTTENISLSSFDQQNSQRYGWFGTLVRRELYYIHTHIKEMPKLLHVILSILTSGRSQ